MVPMQTYSMPQMMQPQRGMMPQQPVQPMQQPVQPMQQPVQPMQQPVQPMAQPMQQPVQPMAQPVQPMQQPVQPMAQPVQPVAQPVQQPVQEQPAPPIQGTMEVSSFEDMPVSADALMNEEEKDPENAEESIPIPDETELLNQIFSDNPKHNTMSKGTKPSAQTFSISLSASEVTSVKQEPPAPAAPPAPKPEKKRKKAEEEAPAPAPAPKKPPQIVSPEAFFGDDTPKAKRYAKMNVETPTIADDDQLAAKIAALEVEGHKRSKRTMEAADLGIDAQKAVDDPAVAAAAQALMEDAAN